MEHPLIHNLDSLTMDELQIKIQELNRHLRYAQRINNSFLVGQVSMALESYNNAYKLKQKTQFDSQHGNSAPDFSDRINIS